ncbi:uncharacterized protein LOC135929817 [Gordionus sp. m RMFG-2023]|uniref:uncharacterized protein LOC135929817 n=1 Tax=Gordionus sp. m RMFG-2023 TaxID=3053472 RepID=UPI0031FC1507
MLNNTSSFLLWLQNPHRQQRKTQLTLQITQRRILRHIQCNFLIQRALKFALIPAILEPPLKAAWRNHPDLIEMDHFLVYDYTGIDSSVLYSQTINSSKKNKGTCKIDIIMEDFHFSSQTSVRALYESDHKFVHYQVETPKLEETITPKKWENPVYYFSCHTQTNVKKVFWINDVKLDHTAKEGDAYLSNYEFEQVKLRLSNSKKLDYWILSCLPFVIQLNDLKLPSVDKFVNCTDIPACRTNIMFRKKINWLYKPVPLSYNLSVNEGEDLELKLKFRETMGSTRIYRAKWILDNRTLRNFSMDFDLRVEKIKKPFPGTFHRFTCTYLALYDINFPQKDEHFELGSVDVFVEVKTLPFCEVSITLTKDGQKTRITQPYIEMVEGRQNLEIDCSVNSFATNSGPMLENHRLKHVSPLSGKLLSNDIGSDYTINNYLVIDQLHRNHAGSISCASTDFPYPCRRQFYLSVFHGPKVRSVYPLQNPKIGDRVVLECEYESYPRPFEVAWIHHTSGFAKISMQKKLVINEFSSYQYGDYACVISNKFYDENKNLQINTESSRIRAIPSLERSWCGAGKQK